MKALVFEKGVDVLPETTSCFNAYEEIVLVYRE
jgi:hypothetical protein